MGIDLELIVSIISDALRALFGFLCEIIYTGIASLYDLFIRLGSFTYVDEFSVIYNKISLIIGIFMVFRVTFWLLEALINPDTITDKEKKPTKIVQKVLVSVVLLAITPSIFEYAFKLQDAILNSNIIENIISIDEVNDTTTSGRLLSAELFTSFYTPTETDDGIIESDCSDMFAGKSGAYYENLREYGKLENLNNYCLTERVDEKDRYSPYVINFNGLFATAVGIFVFWMILMYCISLGTRYVQLVYLQIIAPIPIMCNLAPGKDNMFSKWVKQCTTTYLDLFIRIIIINFVMVLSSMVINTDIITNFGGDNPWIKIFLILGLLTFAKKAPDLIQELLPKSFTTKASGDFGLSWKKRTDSMIGGKYVSTIGKAATAGVASAGLTGAIGFLGRRGTGRITGMLGGIGRGFVAGSSKGSAIKNISGSMKKQYDFNRKKIDLENNGSTFGGRMSQRAANILGYEGRAEEFDNRIASIDKDIETKRDSIAQKKRQSVAYKEISSGKSNMENRAESKLLNEAYDPSKNPVRYELQEKVLKAKATLEHLQQTGASADDIVKAQMQYNSVLKDAKRRYITAVLGGELVDENGKPTTDAAMLSMYEHMQNIVRTAEDGTFDVKELNLSNYTDLDNFEVDATNKNNRVTEGYTYQDANGKEQRVIGINEVETAIKSLEDKKAEIKAKEEYKNAQADRDAVGGHKGGK